MFQGVHKTEPVFDSYFHGIVGNFLRGRNTGSRGASRSRSMGNAAFGYTEEG